MLLLQLVIVGNNYNWGNYWTFNGYVIDRHMSVTSVRGNCARYTLTDV